MDTVMYNFVEGTKLLYILLCYWEEHVELSENEIKDYVVIWLKH
jgi:hypothetical protein